MSDPSRLDDAHALSGIIDWSDAGIADPSVDFVGLYTWGGAELTDRAAGTTVQIPLDGSYSSTLLVAPVVPEPPVTSTFPLRSNVAV